MTAREVAQILLRKALQDEGLVRNTVDNDDIADEIIAFHAQQAVEKCLKAILTLRRVSWSASECLRFCAFRCRAVGASFRSPLV